MAKKAVSVSAPSSRPANRAARRRRQISIMLSTTPPISSGNQPPAGILCRLPATKARSSSRSGAATAATSGQDTPQWPRATATMSSVVTSMSPATAIP